MTREEDAETSGTSDGRSIRRDRNIDRAIDAFLKILDDGHRVPTFEQVAVAAGLSVSSVYRYFDHIDDLFEQATIRHHGVLYELLKPDVDEAIVASSLEVRISKYLEERESFRLASATRTPGAVVTMVGNPRLAGRVADMRAELRLRVPAYFAAELAKSQDPGERELRISAVYVACSMATRQYLQGAGGLAESELAGYSAWQIRAALTTDIF